MARRVWTEEHDDAIRRLHADQAGPMQVAREVLGDPSSTGRMAILKRASELGLTWEHRSRETAKTAAARAAREADYRARKARLRASVLAEAERLLDELHAPVTVFNFGGKDNTYEEREIGEPTHADKLKLAQAVGTLTTTVEKLERLEADAGTAEAAGALDRIGAAITAAAAALRHPDAGTDEATFGAGPAPETDEATFEDGTDLL